MDVFWSVHRPTGATVGLILAVVVLPGIPEGQPVPSGSLLGSVLAPVPAAVTPVFRARAQAIPDHPVLVPRREGLLLAWEWFAAHSAGTGEPSGRQSGHTGELANRVRI